MKPVISFAASLAAIAAVLASSSPAFAKKRAPVQPSAPVSFPQSERDYDALFSGRPAVQRVRVPGGLFLSRPVAGEAPQGVLSKMVEIDIRSEVPTLADLQMLLEAHGVPVTIDWRSLAAGTESKGRIDSFNVQSRYDCISKSANVGTGVRSAVGGQGGVSGISGSNGSGGLLGQSGGSQSGQSGDPCQDDQLKGAYSDDANNPDSSAIDGQQSQQGLQAQQSQQANNAANPSNEGADAAATALGRQTPAFYDRVLPFRYFRGTVGELMRRLENTGNIAVWYENGIVLGDVRRYSVAVMQNRDVVQSTVNELRRLGAKDVLGSIGAGQVFYSSPPRTNNEVIEPYLRRLSGNLSEVTMQVALVTVSMSKTAEAGFDWSKFNLGFGQNVNSVADSSGELVPLLNAAGVLQNGVFGANLGNVFGKLLSVAGAIKYLSTVGNTNIAQNVELRTLSGSPVLLRSGEQIPFVKNVNAVSNGSLGGGTASGSETQNLGTGLTLNLDPRYDSSSGIVTMDVGIKLVDLVEFVQLNAGQLGTLTQPRTREQAVNSIIRVPAGQTTILGGIRRDLSVTSRNGPFGAFGIGSKNRQNEVFWLFAIVRPVVTVYETADAPVAPRSVLDTRTTVNPYDEGSYGSVGVPGPSVYNPNDPQTTNLGGVPSYYGNRAVTPANRQPAGVTTSSPPAPRNLVVPNASTQPEVNGNLPSGSVQRDPGSPRLDGRVGTASTPTSPYQVPPVQAGSTSPVSRQPSGATTIEGETNVPQAVNQLQTPSPQPKRSFVRPMTAAEQSGEK